MSQSVVVGGGEELLLARCLLARCVDAGRATPWRRVGTLEGGEVRFGSAWRALEAARSSRAAERGEPALELAVRVGGEVRVIARLALTAPVVRAIEGAILRAERTVEGGPAPVRSRWPHLARE